MIETSNLLKVYLWSTLLKGTPFQDQSQSEDEKKDYVALMKTQTLAAFMAKKFNKLLPPTAKKIR